MKQQSAIRPAWLEINLDQLRQNFALINAEKPARLKLLFVVKDNAYGHGAVETAIVAAQCGISYLGTVTVDEAIELRQAGIDLPIFVMAERTREELAACIKWDLTCCINDLETARYYAQLANAAAAQPAIHVEVDTGMGRYGVRWTLAADYVTELQTLKSLRIEGIFSHFAMSDELDKTYAYLQLGRFNEVLTTLQERAIKIPLRHICNSGGYLDLPDAHFDMVRLGTLPLGVYPSRVCRRVADTAPIMTLKTKIAALQHLQPGDKVGYGMRYTVTESRTIAVLPLGYGDGYPRIRNAGQVLVRGKRAAVVGGNAMDAMMVDVTDIPDVARWDEVVLLGCQGEDEISVRELADLKGSVTYDIINGWRSRIPRVYHNREDGHA